MGQVCALLNALLVIIVLSSMDKSLGLSWPEHKQVCNVVEVA